MKKSIKLPFCAEDKYNHPAGDLLPYPYPFLAIDWRENTPFYAKMTIADYERGRSAARFNVKDEVGHIYPIFLSDMVDIIKTVGVGAGGVISGNWIGVKKGRNYGLKLIIGYDVPKKYYQIIGKRTGQVIGHCPEESKDDVLAEEPDVYFLEISKADYLEALKE